MPRLTDQLQRLTFPAEATGLAARLAKVGADAQGMLLNRSPEELTCIGLLLESALQRQATEHFDLGVPSTGRSKGPAPASDRLDPVAACRWQVGDLGLLLEEGVLEAINAETPGLEVTPWEAFAILAIWKIKDLQDLLALPLRDGAARPHPAMFYAGSDCPATIDPRAARELSAMLALEAADALGRYRAALHEGGYLTLADLEAKRRRRTHEAAKVGANGRQLRMQAVRAEALSIASSRPFTTWTAAANHVRDILDKGGNGTRYTERTIIGWLKKGGWRPQAKVLA